MKTVDPALAAIINNLITGDATQTFVYAHVYTITLFGSLGGQTVIHLTDAPLDVLWNGNIYLSNTVRVDQRANKRLAHWKRGLDVDTATVVLAQRTLDPITGASFPDKIGTVPFIEAARGGALDGADVLIERVFFARWQDLAVPFVTDFLLFEDSSSLLLLESGGLLEVE